ncbi:MAG: hypothetical protein ING75_15170 [Rhodocyclaceae bacterium]|nr:hypothetical protein [Rhodocyclaceae bacterium]
MDSINRPSDSADETEPYGPRRDKRGSPRVVFHVTVHQHTLLERELSAYKSGRERSIRIQELALYGLLATKGGENGTSLVRSRTSNDNVGAATLIGQHEELDQSHPKVARPGKTKGRKSWISRLFF